MSGSQGGQEIASGVRDVGQGVSDFFTASALGDQEAAYKKEASFYSEAAGVERSSTQIQEFQVQRQATKAIGGQEAAVAASGFLQSGSALDITRESAMQANIARSVVAENGEIKVQSDIAQSEAATDAARAAGRSKVGMQIVGGISVFNGISEIGDGIAQEVMSAESGGGGGS